MNYRKYGKLDYESSILGFGCMRLPVTKDNPQEIDEAEAIRIIRYGIDNGINYVDTAYPYHGGKSEALVGKALKDGYREKVKLATKLPIWMVEKLEDCDKYLDEQLQRLDDTYVDFYLLHALNKERWQKIVDLGVLGFVDKAKKEGKIRHSGFSFHEEISFFRTIIDSYDWDMCQIQFNYMEDPKWEEEIKYAASKGIAIVVMEPLLGGKLASNTPEDVQAIWDEADTRRSAVDWALSWVYNHPEITMALSGMGAIEQVAENIAIAGRAEANALSEKDMSLIKRVREAYESKIRVKCTECEYCMPCPNNINIPAVFYAYNNAFVYNAMDSSKNMYEMISKKASADKCVECGKCESACPQQLPITKHLKDAHEILKK